MFRCIGSFLLEGGRLYVGGILLLLFLLLYGLGFLYIKASGDRRVHCPFQS